MVRVCRDGIRQLHALDVQWRLQHQVDLLLIYPVLIVLSISGGVVALASVIAVSRSDH
jgi:hypothetical protein